MTSYGFEWGPMKVERWTHIDGRGYVLNIGTSAGESLQIYVSEGGRSLRVFDPSGGEWVAP